MRSVHGKGVNRHGSRVLPVLAQGCGAGKAVFLAALFFEFEKCGGIEMIQGLSAKGKDLVERWKNDLAPTLPEGKAEATKLSLEAGDMLLSTGANDWAKNTHILMNGPTFSDHLLEQLAVKANGRAVHPETVVITVSMPWAQLDKDKWALIAEDSCKMSWGKAKVFVYEKLPDASFKPPPVDDGKKGRKKKKKPKA